MMGLKDELLGAAKRTASVAGQQVAAGLNRADELGGDLRDYLLTRTDKPGLHKLGQRLAKFGGLSVSDLNGASEAEVAHEEAANAAPPPTAAALSEEAARKGLGDPDIAAQIYGRKSCPWSGRAITLLNEGKVDYDFIDMDDSENGHFEGKLVAETKQSTVPFIFLRGEFVGGFNEVNEVVRLGELAYRILSVEDKKASDAVRKHVEIAPRKAEAADDDTPTDAPN
jgi:glutaredoxin